MTLGFQQTPGNHGLFLSSSGVYSAYVSSLSGHFSLQTGPGWAERASGMDAALGGGGHGDPVPMPWGHVPAHGSRPCLRLHSLQTLDNNPCECFKAHTMVSKQ